MAEAPGVREVRDRQAWDAFVADHPEGNFLQSWRWGELKAHYGWCPLRLAAPASGPIRAGLQVLVQTRGLLPLGPRAGVAYVPRGPLLSAPDDALALLRAALLRARQAGASFVRVEPPGRAAVQSLRALGFRPTAQFIQIPRTALVDLRPDPDAILARFKPKMRYNIRLGARRGIEVVEGSTAADFKDFFSLTEITASRERFAIHTPAYYRDVWETFRPDQGALLTACYQGEPLAAVVTLRFGPTAVYLYGASASRHRNLMAPHAAQWAAMRWAKARGCRWYDLWGVADPDDPADPLAGVHRFKLGFNPRIVEYPGAFDRPLQALRAWALTQGVLRARNLANRWRSRPVREASRP